ncbi:hypothetical protein B5M09_003304 [Aphanomyces astaci]|uniref:Cyclic nucleotide-binding domain-containing protein n=1 Tax=Aphanomyces astaci TaxID=112090 RepID=A0A3R7YCQ4_APHAT|nr:hypothetical protein B5M09_003304 [Aphanomyces astaci]
MLTYWVMTVVTSYDVTANGRFALGSKHETMHLIKTTVASNNGGSSSWMKPDSLSTSRFGDDGGDEGSSHLEHIASQLIMSEDEDDSAPVMSAYMTRQAERAGITGLSPMEEMRLAHGELAAKVAKKRDLDDLPAASFRLNHYLRVPPVKKVLKRMHSSMTGISSSKKKRRDGFRNAPSVVCEAEVKRITQELANNMDDMTAGTCVVVDEEEASGKLTLVRSEQAINFVQSVQQREDIIKMRVDDYDAKRVPWFLISPASKFRVRWDILSVTMAFTFPTDVPALEVMDQFQIMFNVLYFMDVVCSQPHDTFENLTLSEGGQLFLGVRSPRSRGNPVDGHHQAIPSNLVPWSMRMPVVIEGAARFIVDMLAATPVEAIYMALHRHDLTSSNLNKYFKYLRIVKLSRMLGFTHILNRLVVLSNSLVVATVANLNHNDTEFQHKMDGINNFMERRDLPMELRTEIREFFMNSRLSTENTLKNESKILSELSALLRSKIALAINDSVLNKMPFFEGADHNFLMELALSMKMVCFPPHEEVIVEGEIGQEMFFIFRGAVEVMKDGDQIAVLGEQQYFGEMAIMNTNCMRLASVRTLCFCELRMLTRQKFLVALSHFPSMRKRIARIIHRRKVTHDQEMVHRKSSDFTGPTAPPSIKQKSTPRGGIHRRGSASPTAMEDLAASMVQGSHNLLEKVVGPDIFALEADAIVGSTMQRISQMNIVPNRNNDGAMAEGPPSDELRMIIHTLLEQQEMLLTEVAKLEDKVRALLPPSDPVKAGPHESYLTP